MTMILPQRYDITIEVGATWNVEVTLQDPGGNPVDLSVRQLEASAWNDRRTEKLFDIQLNVLNAAAGRIEMLVPANAPIPFRNARIGSYRLRVTEPNGREYYWLEGDVTIRAGIPQ